MGLGAFGIGATVVVLGAIGTDGRIGAIAINRQGDLTANSAPGVER